MASDEQETPLVKCGGVIDAGSATVENLMARGFSRAAAAELAAYAARLAGTNAGRWMVLCVGGPFDATCQEVPPGWSDTLGVEGHAGHYRLANTGSGWRWMWRPTRAETGGANG